MFIIKSLVFRCFLVLVGLYLLLWAFYGVEYLYVKHVLNSRYGNPTPFTYCSPQPQPEQTIYSFQLGGNSSPNKSYATPLSLFTTDYYKYDISYTKGHSGVVWEAIGTINYLGRISETSDQFLNDNNQACLLFCLSASTVIDTDIGQKPVTALRVGEKVWSIDGNGNRVLAPIIQVVQRRVPLGVFLLHIVLADNRQLTVSPNHPTVDGIPFKDLHVGETLDHVQIIRITQVSYNVGYTYDILPRTTTATYWANNVLVGSTLKP